MTHIITWTTSILLTAMAYLLQHSIINLSSLDYPAEAQTLIAPMWLITISAMIMWTITIALTIKEMRKYF